MSDFRSNIISILDLDYNKNVKNATKEELYNAVSKAIIKSIQEKKCLKSEEKRVYCISMEYSLGNLIYGNLLNMGLNNQLVELMTENGIDMSIFEYMKDLGYGFTKDGYVAESFIEAATTAGIDFYGYGLRYKYGYYKQCIENNEQVEKIDDWERCGDVWAKRRDDEKIIVKFKDQNVYAIPYDVNIVGYGAKNINTLRLWQAEAINEFDYVAFAGKKYEKAFKEKEQAEILTSIFCANDENENIQNLKLKQQYFLVSASIKDIIRKYKKKGHIDFSRFVYENAVQLSDMGSTLAIAEIMRIFMEEEKMTVNKSLKIIKEVFSYTSIEQEEQIWNVKDVKMVLPSLYKYAAVIGKIFAKKNIDDNTYVNSTISCANENKCNAIVDENNNINPMNIVKFVCGARKTRIGLKEISQRDWLYLINQELTCFLNDKIGNIWITNLEKLGELEKYLEDDTVISEFEDIKTIKKRQLVEYIYDREHIKINKECIFRLITKNIEESINKINDICKDIKYGQLKKFYPTVYLFKLKSHPNDDVSKQCIKKIIQLINKINEDYELQELVKVVFLTDYNVTYAKKVIPAVDIVDDFEDVRFLLNGAIYKEIEDNEENYKLDMGRKSLINIINVSGFSIDNLINEYKKNIWKVI